MIQGVTLCASDSAAVRNGAACCSQYQPTPVSTDPRQCSTDHSPMASSPSADGPVSDSNDPSASHTPACQQVTNIRATGTTVNINITNNGTTHIEHGSTVEDNEYEIIGVGDT